MANNRAQILITAVDQTRDAFASVRDNLAKLGDQSDRVKVLLAGLGVSLSAVGFVAMIKHAIDTADELNKLSQKIGISVEALSTLRFAAQLSDVSLETLQKGIKGLSQLMTEANTGVGDGAVVFDTLGVSVKNADGSMKSTQDVLLQVANVFANLEDGAVKTSLAVKLFGKSGMDMIPMLNLGAAGINQLTAEAERLGLKLSTETARSAEAFNDNLTALKASSSALGISLSREFLPELINISNAMREAVAEGGKMKALWVGLGGVGNLLFNGTEVNQAQSEIKRLQELVEGARQKLQSGKASVPFLPFDVKFNDLALATLRKNLGQWEGELTAAQGRLKSLTESNKPEAKKPEGKPTDDMQRIACVVSGGQWVGGQCVKRETDKGQADRDTTGAKLTLIKGQAEAEFKLLKQGFDLQKAALDRALEDRLMSIKDYYARKQRVEQQSIDQEIRARQEELTAQSAVAVNGKDEVQRLRAKAEIKKLEGEIAVLNLQRSESEVTNAHAAAKAEKELATALALVRDEFLQITNTGSDGDRRSAVERQFTDLKARLNAQGDTKGVSLVDRLIDVKAAQANLTVVEAQWRQVTERMRNAQDSIRVQQQAGLLSESQARTQLVDLQKQSAVEMERLLPTMQQVATAIGPEAVVRVQAWRNELERTKLVVDEMAPLWSRIGESFGGALSGMVTGMQTWRSAMSTLIQQVADAFLQQIVIQPFQQWVAMQARMLALKLGFIQQEQIADAAAGAVTVAQKSAETSTVVALNAAKAGSGAAASQASIPYVGPVLAIAAMVAMVAAVSALMGGVKKFATGGMVTGPGTSTSDSIPARLSAGEYIVRAAAVRQVGVAFLDSINGLSVGPRFRGSEMVFASGGLVPEVRMPAAQPQASQSVRIVNAIDPGLTHDHLQSPAGEKVIVNIIGRNARAIRAALQG